MTPKTSRSAARWLLTAAVTLGAAGAHAAAGVSITTSQESSVRSGMTSTEVEQVLGRPAHIVSYRNAPGATWIYHVINPSFGTTDFDVSFGADGRVMWATERVIGGSGR